MKKVLISLLAGNLLVGSLFLGCTQKEKTIDEILQEKFTQEELMNIALEYQDDLLNNGGIDVANCNLKVKLKLKLNDKEAEQLDLYFDYLEKSQEITNKAIENETSNISSDYVPSDVIRNMTSGN